MSETLEGLKSILESSCTELPKVTWKRMFGCDAAFANGSIFGLIWKKGRIGIKLPKAQDFDELMKEKGAAPWKAGNMTMSHWVLVPVSMHKEPRQLKPWIKTAHTSALSFEKTPKKAKSPAKKGRKA